MDITYFDEDGMVYWTMGDPIETTTIINRCTKEQSYEYRLAHDDLPKQLVLLPTVYPACTQYFITDIKKAYIDCRPLNIWLLDLGSNQGQTD